jgi:hypothetical protein
MSNSVKGPEALGNRRAYRRAALSAPVLLDSARSHYTGRCRDVSEGGLLVELETELPVGMPVDLYFELPTGIAIEAHAAIARSEKSVLGLRFDSLSAEDRRAVAAYCETWRAALLKKCARRVASMPNQRLTASALASSGPDSSSPSEFDASEPNSGVRIRIAEWHDTEGASKQKRG